MRLIVTIVINALLLGAFLRWLWCAHRQASPALRHWLLPALGWRLLFTALSSARPGPDLSLVARWRLMADYFLEHPSQILTMLQQSDFHYYNQKLHYFKWSNALFFYKFLALLNLLSNGTIWTDGIYLSVLCFIASWTLVQKLNQVFAAAPAGAAGIAFLAWPTVIWWTAGLTKETLLMGAESGFVALWLTLLYQGWPTGLWRVLSRVLMLLLLAWVMVRIRYFFALPLLGGLVALALVRLATRRGWLGVGRWSQVGGMLLLLVLAAGLGIIVSNKVVSVKFLADEVGRNYQHGLFTSSGRPHLEYADWDPSPLGLLRHAPAAAVQMFVRPWLGESNQPLYVAAGLESMLLTGLLVLALVAVWRGRAGHLPPALVIMLVAYCLLLAAFIGLSTPNLGTLNRYRTALLPWLLFLLLQNDYARRLMRMGNLE